MAKVTFTDRTCQTIKPIEGHKQTEYYDARTRGLALRVSSQTKTWFFGGRVGEKVVRITLGTYPGLGLADAREAAERVRSEIRQGEDPTVTRRAKLDAVTEAHKNTFEALTREFMAAIPSRRPRTIEGYKYLFASLKAWNTRPVGSIKRSELIAIRDQFQSAGQHHKARLAMAMLGKFFRWLKDEREVIVINPANGIKLQKKQGDLARERVLTPEELARIWRGAEVGLNPVASAFVKVLMLTALRRNETSMILWSWLELDAKEPVLNLPASVTKGGQPLTVPLVPQVVALFKGLPRIEGKADFVFTLDGTRKISGYSKNKTAIEAAIKETGEVVIDWRLHDFRRAFSSYANEHDLASSDTVEACLNHISHKTTVQRTYDKSKRLVQRRRLLTLWTEVVMSAVEGKGLPTNVVAGKFV